MDLTLGAVSDRRYHWDIEFRAPPRFRGVAGGTEAMGRELAAWKEEADFMHQ